MSQSSCEEFVFRHDITEHGSPVASTVITHSIRIAVDRAYVPYPENSLAGVGSHGVEGSPMAEVTWPCEVNHRPFSF